jgi:molybdenum cofactor cytidylyltransferase
MISAIVIAAGESKRMGRPKQLLPWQGKALLQHVLDSLLNSEVDEVILILGCEAERILERLDTRRIKVVLNPDYAQGMITSIQHGLAAIGKGAEAFFIVLGDQPGISPQIYNLLIREFHRVYPSKRILLPTYRGEKGHPALFSIDFREEGSAIKGDVGFRQIISDHPQDVLQIELGTDAVVNDVDTPEDYQDLLKRKSAGELP